MGSLGHSQLISAHSDNKAGPGTAAQSVGQGFAPERLKTLELRVDQENYEIELLFVGEKHLKLCCRPRSTSAGVGRPSATFLSQTEEAARLAGDQSNL